MTIGAFITAQARMLTLNYIAHIQSLRGTVYYCDTDSFHVDIELLEKYG